MSLLEVKHLTKVFEGLIAVEDVSFNVEQGNIVSLIGPNGAGKSTIFAIISGLVKPNEGQVIFNNIDITGMKAYKIANSGLVTTFQKTNVFPTLTVEEAITVGTHNNQNTTLLDILLRNKNYYSELKQAKKRVSKILEYTELIDKKNLNCSELSYGEQRILEIAVALAADPKLLLLDEPAAGLNYNESKKLMNIICELRDAGITILLIEHDMSLVMKISDYITALNFGKQICSGTPQEVSLNGEVIEAYLGFRKEYDNQCY